MNDKNEFEDELDVEDVPVSALFAEGRKNRYGSVPGLDDDELASPEELERQVFFAEWGPILALPCRSSRGWIQPTVEDGYVDWGAFASVDFERVRPEFDKARYKADKLQEQLRDVLILLSVIKHRLTKAHHKVLKYLRMGVLGLDDIRDVELCRTARLYLRVLRLRREIRQLRDASWARRRKELAEVLK